MLPTPLKAFVRLVAFNSYQPYKDVLMSDFWKTTAGPMPSVCRPVQPGSRSGVDPACNTQPSFGEFDRQPARQIVRDASPQSTVEPGFFIVPQTMPPAQLLALLFDDPVPAALVKFSALNPSLSNPVKAGTMIVLGDPSNKQCSFQEAQLMKAAAQVNTTLDPFTADEADFLRRHHWEISSFLSEGSTTIGIGEAMFGKHLEGVRNTLANIQDLHQRNFQQHGHLQSAEFFAERKQLLTHLDNHLSPLVKKGVGLDDHPKIKTALGISSRSLVHHWSKAGGPGQIPGYATHINGVSKASKFITYGGWIGTVIGGGASYMKVRDVCAAGHAEACTKIKYTETGSFAGGVLGGVATGGALSLAAGSICIAIGIGTLGVGGIACGVVVVGVGSSVAGGLGSSLGQGIAEIIYESAK